MPRFHRLAHFQNTPVVKVGDWIKRGQLIGHCGSTGNSSGPHAHYDCPLLDLFKVYGSWRQYVYGWNLSQVKKVYDDPIKFCKNGNPMNAEYPLVGFKYLQGVRDAKGIYFHPGLDLNGINDLGKPIYSPVEGRVIHVEGMTMLGKIFPRFLNGGWGCFIVIEEKPGYVI